jgi:uncharacterized protein (TIGR02996 family)
VVIDIETREAFLRAIFDRPADDTPRLVYADWLEEHGDYALAELIRLQCELDVLRQRTSSPPPAHLAARAEELIDAIYYDGNAPGRIVTGGLPWPTAIYVTADELADPEAFRLRAVTRNPEWFGTDKLKVTVGRIVDGQPFDVIFTAAATRKVSRLILSGIEEGLPEFGTNKSAAIIHVNVEYHIRPVISTAGVVALARHRGAHRLTELDLTYNDLGTDAARALIRSPVLDNLRSLRLMEGNRLRGRVWQDVVERFGEDVVS